MVLWGWAPGVELDAVDVDVEVRADVDVVLDLLSEPQPTSANPSAAVAIAAVKYFINCISPKKWAGNRAGHVKN